MHVFRSFRNAEPVLSLRAEVGQKLASLSDEDFAQFLAETPEHQRPAAVRLRASYRPADAVAH